MANKLSDLLKLEGVIACGAWKPSGTGKRPEIIDAMGEIMEDSVYMASSFCEFDLFTATSQCAIYEQYSNQKKFFPSNAIAIKGAELSIVAVNSNHGDFMVGVFLVNYAKPDLWKLTEEMMDVAV